MAAQVLQSVGEARVGKVARALGTSVITVEADYTRRLENSAEKVRGLQNAWSDLNLTLDKTFLPDFDQLVVSLTGLVRQMDEFAKADPTLTRGLAYTAAGAVSLSVALAALRFGWLLTTGGVLRTARAFLKLGAAVTGANRAASAPVTGFTAYGQRAGRATTLAFSRFLAIGAALETINGIVTDLGRTIEERIEASNRAAKAWQDLGRKLEQTPVGQAWNDVSGRDPAVNESEPTTFSLKAGEAAAAGEAAGAATMEGVAAGMQAGGSAVEAEARAIFEKIKSIFEPGVAVPIKPIMSSVWGTMRPPGSAPAVTGGTPASTSTGRTASSSSTTPARAAGGPVSAGRSYLVGEEGPELFKPKRSGQITDAKRTAAGGNTYRLDVGGIHITAQPGQSPEAVAAAVERRLSQKWSRVRRGAFHNGVA